MPFQTPNDVGSWSHEQLARALTLRARIYGSSQLNSPPRKSEEEKARLFRKAFDPAARDYGFTSYEEVPEGVKSLIGKRGGRGSADKRREIDTVGPAEDVSEDVPPSPPRKVPFPLTQTRWFRQQALRHSWWYLDLHPE